MTKNLIKEVFQDSLPSLIWYALGLSVIMLVGAGIILIIIK